MVHEKINSAFCDVQVPHFIGLIEFWAPIKCGEKRFLSTSDQPFALEHLDTRFHKYRLFSIRYKYSIDVSNGSEVNKDLMIISGPVGTSFVNRFPEVNLDILAHQQCLLVRSALLCGMNCLILLPVFDQSDQSGSCVGVVECCVDVNFVVFVELKLALEVCVLSFNRFIYNYVLIFNMVFLSLQRVGLSTFNVEESRE